MDALIVKKLLFSLINTRFCFCMLFFSQTLYEMHFSLPAVQPVSLLCVVQFQVLLTVKKGCILARLRSRVQKSSVCIIDIQLH